MTIELKFLGTPEAIFDNRPVTAALDRKHIALLAYLAVERAWVARDRAAALLWGEEYTDSKALQNLRQAVHEVNHLLPGAIEKDGRQAIRLGRDASLRLDIEQFEEARAGGNFERAADLYRGTFLDGLSLKNEEAFEEWLRERREAYQRRALACLDTLMSAANARRDNDALERYARRSLANNLEQEDAYRCLMLALGRKGQYNEALRVYSDCVGMLRREFDQSPSAETMAIYERIHLARALPRRDLPFHAATFVGRERELAEATARLREQGCRLLTLLGPGGVGKTRLAIELARRSRSLFLHDVCYVALESRSESAGRENMLLALAGALGVPVSANRLLEDVIDHVRPREMMFVLDNFEAFVPTAGVLHDLLKEAPDLKILVTSRERLDILDEALYPVSGLTYPEEPDSLNAGDGARSLAGYDAPSLFMRAVARLSPALAFSNDATAIARICRRVEGLPLALELIAPWALDMPLNTIVERLAMELGDLIGFERRFPDRHRSLHVVFEYSWSRLTLEEQTALRRLSVIVGPVSKQAAATIAGATETTLQRLSGRSMLQMPVESRYTLHSLVRAFALAKLEEAGELQATRDRHFDYFCGYVGSRLPDLRGADQLATFQQLEEVFADIRAAWGYGAAHAPADTLETLLDGIVRLATARTWFTAGVEALREAAEPLARRGLDDVRVRSLLHEGRMQYHMGHYDAARQCAEAGLRHGEAEANERIMAQALSLMALVHYDHNRYDEAEPLFLRSIDLHRRHGAWEEAGDGLIQLGSLSVLRTYFSSAGKTRYRPPRAFMHEHYQPTPQQRAGAEAALRHYAEALRLFNLANNLPAIAYYWGAVGFPYYVLHDYETAAETYRESVRMFQKLGSALHEGQCLTWLAWVLHHQGKAEEARPVFHEAIRLGVRLSSNKRLMDCLQKYSLFLWVNERQHFMPLALNAYVAHHPSTDGRMRVVAREWIENISDYMRADEGEAAVEKALAYGRQQTVTSLTQRLLDNPNQGG